jgi:hypothetical protein
MDHYRLDDIRIVKACFRSHGMRYLLFFFFLLLRCVYVLYFFFPFLIFSLPFCMRLFWCAVHAKYKSAEPKPPSILPAELQPKPSAAFDLMLSQPCAPLRAARNVPPEVVQYTAHQAMVHSGLRVVYAADEQEVQALCGAWRVPLQRTATSTSSAASASSASSASSSSSSSSAASARSAAAPHNAGAASAPASSSSSFSSADRDFKHSFRDNGSGSGSEAVDRGYRVKRVDSGDSDVVDLTDSYIPSTSSSALSHSSAAPSPFPSSLSSSSSSSSSAAGSGAGAGGMREPAEVVVINSQNEEDEEADSEIARRTCDAPIFLRFYLFFSYFFVLLVMF